MVTDTRRAIYKPGGVQLADALLLNIFLQVRDKYILVISGPSLAASPKSDVGREVHKEGPHAVPGTRDSGQRLELGFTWKGSCEPPL